ncbi:hypothetical protein GCM10023195_36870 [Actinoallomurus liliacearum]|uniref:Uncharacterized protein n=1 Tax=Actinoallomurus liliacearum TaxID=1080073 RepID=A0ABP8TMA6_9ACTN
MKSHTGLRRRLLTLLAGFFGFVITVVLSAIPGTAVAEVIRVGETANAAGTGGSAATVAALDRSRRSKHSRAAPVDTPGDRGATVPSRTSSAGALAVPDEDGTADTTGRRPFTKAVAPGSPTTDRAAGEHRTASARSPSDTASTTAGRDCPRAVSAKAGGAGPGAAVPAVADRVRTVRRAITAVVAARTVTPPAVFLSAVSLRGPPPHTGS